MLINKTVRFIYIDLRCLNSANNNKLGGGKQNTQRDWSKVITRSISPASTNFAPVMSLFSMGYCFYLVSKITSIITSRSYGCTSFGNMLAYLTIYGTFIQFMSNFGYLLSLSPSQGPWTGLVRSSTIRGTIGYTEHWCHPRYIMRHHLVQTKVTCLPSEHMLLN